MRTLLTVSPTPASRRASAFTLIELLVVAAIIATLAALIFPVVGKVQSRARQTREINAARQIMVAFASYAGANDGELVGGYNTSVTSVAMPSGHTVTGIMCARYPWRLAPYISEAIDDIFLVNETRTKTSQLKPDAFEYQYQASLYPALGINGYCIGGVSDGSTNFQQDVVKRMGGTQHAVKLIAFVSARYTQGGGKSMSSTNGFHMVTPPRFWRTNWQTPWDRDKMASNFGNVDLRWDNKATCAFLDGHVEMLGEKELMDMRHWSNAAAEEDNPSYTIPR